MQNCQDLYCHVYWVQDSQNSDHYVCLKCGKERWISGNPAMGFFVVFIIVAIAGFITLVTDYRGDKDNRKTSVSFQDNQHSIILSNSCQQCRDARGNYICCP